MCHIVVIIANVCDENWIILLPWRWKQVIPWKQWYLSTKLHGSHPIRE